MKAPVLLIVFNRLSSAQKVFAAIAQYKPSVLFVFADGWREGKPLEKEKCVAVREWILSNVDWDCHLETMFLDANIGCGKGPSTAISWFFRNVESGIILEDDCVPHPDFFSFASRMLEEYKGDDNVMAVNSSNFQNSAIGDGSYYFSMQNGPFCAWATWKRAWLYFDYSMARYSRWDIMKPMMFYYKVTKRERIWWLKIYDNLKADIYNGSSWDYQFIFAIWANCGRSIVPNSNLSTNIGFGPDATHTTNPDAVTANRPLRPLPIIEKPTDNSISREADLYYHDFYYERFVEHISFIKKVKRLVKKIIGWK